MHPLAGSRRGAGADMLMRRELESLRRALQIKEDLLAATERAYQTQQRETERWKDQAQSMQEKAVHLEQERRTSERLLKQERNQIEHLTGLLAQERKTASDQAVRRKAAEATVIEQQRYIAETEELIARITELAGVHAPDATENPAD